MRNSGLFSWKKVYIDSAKVRISLFRYFAISPFRYFTILLKGIKPLFRLRQRWEKTVTMTVDIPEIDCVDVPAEIEHSFIGLLPDLGWDHFIRH